MEVHDLLNACVASKTSPSSRGRSIQQAAEDMSEGSSGSTASQLAGCFVLAGDNFGRMFDHSFPACAFFLSFFFFYDVEISSRTLIPLFMPESVYSGSAS